MSSDSDDDFSYTNTASMLKALKKDISFSEEKNVPMDDNNYLCSNDSILVEKLHDEHPSSKKSQTDLDISCTPNLVSKMNDSVVILSDDELQNSPINLISQIDSVLVKAQRRSRSNTKISGRGRGRGKCNNTAVTPRRSTRSTTRAKSNTNTRGRGRKSISNSRANRQSLNRQVMSTSKNVHKPDICIIDDDNNELQEANYEIDVKVLWMSQYLKKFSIRRFDKIQTIFQFFSERENIPENKLIFTIEKDSVILSKNDTPESLNINAATIIEGGIIKNTEKNQTNKPNKDCIEIKVQLKDRKRPLLITLKNVDKMEVLMHKTATELGVNVKSLKFYFDGDLIKASDTVENLQLEGGECIDCIKIN